MFGNTTLIQPTQLFSRQNGQFGSDSGGEKCWQMTQIGPKSTSLQTFLILQVLRLFLQTTTHKLRVFSYLTTPDSCF